ncbi:SRPBCC domain-containing protein [soil metagenome]
MPTGRTQDAGWQIGVSRTLRATPEQVWDLLTSSQGLAVWLGPGAQVSTERGSPWQANDGTRGEVRSHHAGDRIRLTYQPPGWDHDTTVQVALVPASDGRTGLRFHQERLADAEERVRQRNHWRGVMDRIEAALLSTRRPQDGDRKA